MIKNNIIRVQKNKENPYLILNKTCINDANLSWGAKGLHTYLVSLPDDWTIYVSELTKHTSSGRDHTYTLIKELMKFGYMQRFEYRQKGKVKASNYCVYETTIDVSSFDNTKATIVKIDDNDEVIENTIHTPNTEIPYLAKSDSDSTKLLINNNNKLINKINNNFEEDEETLQEKQLIDLYKSFKLEKRVMPHTLKLLKQNKHVSLEVFEQLFINATSKENVYRYLQEVLKDFNENQIIDLESFKKHIEDRKSKNKKSSNKSVKKECTTDNSKNEIAYKKTKFHNFTENFLDGYKNEDEFEDKIQKMQSEKWS